MRQLVVTLAILGLPVVAHAARPVQVFLNKDGGTVVGGHDDAARGRSSIAAEVDGETVEVPRYRGNAREWKAVMACVQRHFAPFAVDIVDRRPADPGYTMVMVGGHPSLIGGGDGIAGIAPLGDPVVRGAVAFVFTDVIWGAAETCDSIAHEVGHTLGLDHSMACDDLMSYGDCEDRSFTDRAAACGEGEDRTCASGSATQNSFRRLAATVGLRNAPVTPAPSDDAVDLDDGDDDDGAGDDGGWGDPFGDDDGWTDDADAEPDADSDADSDGEPAVDSDADADSDSDCPYADHDPDPPVARGVTLDTGGDTLAGDRWIELRVGGAPRGAAVELWWAMPGGTYTWQCDDLSEDAPVRCERTTDGARFFLAVGTGTRTAAAAVVGRDGKRAWSVARNLELE